MPRLTVQLPSQTITGPGDKPISFEIDAFRKHCLLNGIDDIGLTLQKAAAIDRIPGSPKTKPTLALVRRRLIPRNNCRRHDDEENPCARR